MYLIEDPKVHVVAIPDTMDQLKFDMFHGVWRGGVPFAQHETWHPCFGWKVATGKEDIKSAKIAKVAIEKT